MSLFDKLQRIKQARGEASSGVKTDNPFRDKLDKFDAAVAGLESKSLDLRWRMFHGEDTSAELQELGMANARLVAESGYIDVVESAVANAEGPDKRELEIRNRAIMLNKVRSHPEVSELMYIAHGTQNSFMPEIDGTPLSMGDIKGIQTSSPDQLLRAKAYYTRMQAHEKLGKIKMALVTALNTYTPELTGQPTYSHLVLDTQDTTTAVLYSHLVGYEKGSRNVLEKVYAGVRESFGIKNIPPEDRDFLVHQYIGGLADEILPRDKLLPALKRTLELMGFGKIHGEKFIESIDKPPFRISLVSGEQYAPEECAMRAAPGVDDYRVFINTDLEGSDMDIMRTLLLESGRAVHFYALNKLETRNTFKWDADCVRHAVAMLFGSVTSDEKWLREIAGLRDDEAKYLASAYMLKTVLMKREIAAEALFELQLYHGENPVHAYHGVMERFEGTKLDPSAGLMWAWHPYTAINPCGNLSYSLGLLIHDVFSESVLSRFGTFLDPRVAEYMVDNFFSGMEIPWQDRIKKLSGG